MHRPWPFSCTVTLPVYTFFRNVYFHAFGHPLSVDWESQFGIVHLHCFWASTLCRFGPLCKFKVFEENFGGKIVCESIFTPFELQIVNPCAYFTAAWVKLLWWCHGDTVTRKLMEILTRLLGNCLKILNPWKVHSKVQLTYQLTISWKSLLILYFHFSLEYSSIEL